MRCLKRLLRVGSTGLFFSVNIQLNAGLAMQQNHPVVRESQVIPKGPFTSSDCDVAATSLPPPPI